MMPAPQKPQAAPAPSRMTLCAVKSGKREKPLRVLVYGVAGIGKSTFAAAAPSPVFLCAEDGTAQLDVARFPQPRSWMEAFEAIRALAVEEHPYETLVIDTLDWLEPLCWAHVCQTANKADIESFGYGKGYVAALDQWRVLIARLEAMQRPSKLHPKGIHLVLLGHSEVRKQDDPQTGPFDRYCLKLHTKAAGLFGEWVDALLFARHETFAVEQKGKVRGVSSGKRILLTNWTAAYEAKNRYGLPDELPLDWAEFAAAVKAGATTSETAPEAAPTKE